MPRKPTPHSPHIPRTTDFRGGDRVHTPDGPGVIYWIVEQTDQTWVWIQFDPRRCWGHSKYSLEQISAIAPAAPVQLTLFEEAA